MVTRRKPWMIRLGGDAPSCWQFTGSWRQLEGGPAPLPVWPPRLGQGEWCGKNRAKSSSKLRGSAARRNQPLWRGAKRQKGMKVMMKLFFSYFFLVMARFDLFFFLRRKSQLTLAHQITIADRHPELIGNLKLLLALVSISVGPV